jgi:hypothetical protein
MKPPLQPTEILRRVTRLARFDGMSVLGFAGLFALISAASRDVSGSAIGLLVAAAGAIELHGAALLRGGRQSGMRWLVSSQLYLMATILGYCLLRIAKPDIDWILPYLAGEAGDPIRMAAQQAGMTVEQFLIEGLRGLYVCVAGATVLYQGGMTIYYLSRRAAVEAALQEADPQ